LSLLKHTDTVNRFICWA